MTERGKDVVTLDAGTGRELGLSESDFEILTGTGLPKEGLHFDTDVPDEPFGLFAVQPLNGTGRALFLGGTGTDGDMRFFLDVQGGNVVLLIPGEDGELQTEMVNTSLAQFLEFLRRLGDLMDEPASPTDRARLQELTAELTELSPESFRHPHCWWPMVIDHLRRMLARRDRESGPARSQSDAFDRALDRMYDQGARLVLPDEFAAETDAYGLLTLPADFSDAFSPEGALIRDVTFSCRGMETSMLQAAFAREGLVLVIPPADEPDDEDPQAAYERLIAEMTGPQTPGDDTPTCEAGDGSSDLCRISQAFDLLAQQGYVAEPALWPTNSGCWERVAELVDDPSEAKAVFWNTQSHAEAFDPRGDLTGPLFLTWSGDRDTIAEALSTTGVTVTVPNDASKTFILEPTPA
ncbi:SUKH-4 family immunity protein [Actinomadura rupiterrae]|uniref:SUKH-4 family immunity protein n=1 Tax=Actinomadura rupiterrae TaxID=559627 RepID=UPI0020A307DC|nr:SUKH-4 family immunity protein [Actinomadura rupiterrae]MCP2336149.1 hypothetical protein [Actinomadura rupiterrae]